MKIVAVRETSVVFLSTEILIYCSSVGTLETFDKVHQDWSLDKLHSVLDDRTAITNVCP